MEQGSVDAAVMLDPAITLLQGKNKDLKILSDTRTQKDTLDVFGGEYPGGALYTKSAWIAAHPKETQALTNAIVATLKWIHSHTPEEIMAKMPDDLVGADKALYLAALKNTIPMYSTTGQMDPKGAQAVLDVFSQSSPEVKNAKIDLSKTYTNKFVEAAAGQIAIDPVDRFDTDATDDRMRRGHCLRRIVVWVTCREHPLAAVARRLRPCRQFRRGVRLAAARRRGVADPHRAVLQPHRLWRTARAARSTPRTSAN